MAKLSHRRKYGWTKSHIKKNLVKVNIFGARLSVHRKVAKNYQAFHRRVRAYERAHGLRPYEPDQIGTFNYRNMRKYRLRALTGGFLSEHALGVAMDLDWATNPMTRRRYKTTIPRYVINIAKLCGLDWGGNWRTIFDPMHFQIGDGVIRPFSSKPKKETSEMGRARTAVKKYGIIKNVKNRDIDMNDLVTVAYRLIKLILKLNRKKK